MGRRVAQRLALLDHHPGFAGDLDDLQRTEPSPQALAGAAAKWQVTEADLVAIVDNRPLTETGDKIFVELHPTEFVVRIPRPLTSARREAIRRWMIETRAWPWLHERKDGNEWQVQGDAHAAPEAVARLDWYDRWQSGEHPAEIAASLPFGRGGRAVRIPDETVRTTLQRIHEQLKRISPEGLRSPGP